ncbi:MAG TPA: hypothetical protein VNO53_00720 [Steroidobacteraceae bacterium]|nr:hypothetical protein [Steroidobacteraceae bacterium]
MPGLVKSLADIALLRGDPSVLPSSWASVALFVLAYAVADVVVASTGSIQPILARTAVDLALTLPFFWLLLALTRRTHRFPQTVNAALGVYVLLAPVIILLLLLRNPARTNQALSLLVTASFTVFMIWYLLIVGHILRSALDTGLVTGFAIAVTWLVVTVAISRSLFGAAT